MNHKELHRELTIKKMKLDKFFSMFLEKYSHKMDPTNPTGPIWSLYKTKCEEYNKIAQQIRNEEYWIQKYV